MKKHFFKENLDLDENKSLWNLSHDLSAPSSSPPHLTAQHNGSSHQVDMDKKTGLLLPPFPWDLVFPSEGQADSIPHAFQLCVAESKF